MLELIYNLTENPDCYMRIIHEDKMMLKVGITPLDLSKEYKFVFRRDKPRNANMTYNGRLLTREDKSTFWYGVCVAYLRVKGYFKEYDSSSDHYVTDEERRAREEREYKERLIEECINRDWRCHMGGQIKK